MGEALNMEDKKLDNLTVKSGILGFAIGDALGVPVEFTTREERRQNPVRDMIGYGSHNVPEGTWSDDTSMSIAFMDSIIQKKEINYNDIMDKFCDWCMDAKYTATDLLFDIGITTRRALSSFYCGDTPAIYSGMSSEKSNGNGSLMRMLPVAMYLYAAESKFSEPEEIIIINNLSALTHAHEISKLGCKIFCDYMKKIFSGASKCDAYEYIRNCDYKKYYSDYAVDTYSRLLADDIRKLKEEEISSSGYVVSTLEAALWCTLNCDTYEKAVMTAVNLGNDTDTVGAIVGGINACLYGKENFPERWISKLKKKEYLEYLAEKFFDTINMLYL